MPGGAITNKNGLAFEEMVQIKEQGRDITKNKMYTYLKEQGINWKDYISKKILPDGVFIQDNKVRIYEKKFQSTSGSVDEKIQTAPFKLYELKKLFAPLGITDVTYTYILNDWFEDDKYRDVLEYIRNSPGCDYIIVKGEQFNAIK